MPEERPTTEVEARLDRIGENVAELKGEMRQVDKRMSSIELRMSSIEQGQQDLRKDTRQVLYLVIVGILIPILLEFVKRATN
jgi:hypothetical protein